MYTFLHVKYFLLRERRLQMGGEKEKDMFIYLLISWWYSRINTSEISSFLFDWYIYIESKEIEKT